MNKKTRVGLTILVAVIMLLTMIIPTLAKKPADFTLSYVFEGVDWENNYAEGTFSSEGVIQVNSGDAITYWIPRTGVRQGTMIFKDSGNGDFYIRYTLSKDEGNYCGSGHFDIIAFRGTGIYEGMWGGGDLTMCRPDWGDDINGTLTGWVDFE